MTTFFNRCF